MKIEHFNKIDDAIRTIDEVTKEVDLKLIDENWETWTEVNEWNNRYLNAVNELRDLREEMIFTFKLTD